MVGNPPFLGDRRKCARELGGAITLAKPCWEKPYTGRVPGGADLVCYWFDKAHTQIEARQLTVAGLVSTNSIRGGANRKVLDAIEKTLYIFEAWSDEGWVNDGASVRVSLVAFGDEQAERFLDGVPVTTIHAISCGPSLQTPCDLTAPSGYWETTAMSFQGQC